MPGRILPRGEWVAEFVNTAVSMWRGMSVNHADRVGLSRHAEQGHGDPAAAARQWIAELLELEKRSRDGR